MCLHKQIYFSSPFLSGRGQGDGAHYYRGKAPNRGRHEAQPRCLPATVRPLYRAAPWAAAQWVSSALASGESRGVQPPWQEVWRMCLHEPISLLPPSCQEGGQGDSAHYYRGAAPNRGSAAVRPPHPRLPRRGLLAMTTYPPSLRAYPPSLRALTFRHCECSAAIWGGGAAPLPCSPLGRRRSGCPQRMQAGSPEGCNPPGRRYGGCASINRFLYFPLPERKGAWGMVRTTIEAKPRTVEGQRCGPSTVQPHEAAAQWVSSALASGESRGVQPPWQEVWRMCLHEPISLLPLPERKGARGMVRTTIEAKPRTVEGWRCGPSTARPHWRWRSGCPPALASGESRGVQPHWQEVWRTCLHKQIYFSSPFLSGRGPGDGACHYRGAAPSRGRCSSAATPPQIATSRAPRNDAPPAALFPRSRSKLQRD